MPLLAGFSAASRTVFRAAMSSAASAAAAACGGCAAAPSAPVAVSSLCAACGRAWVGRLDTWLLDCDGVVWRGGEAVSGAGAAARALSAAGKRVFFVSNNSTKSVAEYQAKLASVCGVSAAAEQVVTSAVAAAAW